MRLSKSELMVLEQIANGNKKISQIASAIKRSNKQVYVIAKQLSRNKIIQLSNGTLYPQKAVHVTLLLQLLSKTPSLSSVLADSGLPLITVMRRPATIKEIMIETGFKRATVFKKLKQAKTRSIIRKNANTYEINEKLWPLLKTFVEALKQHELVVDDRIPASATIYHKNASEVIFSSKEKLDATLTAFSAYENYGIKLLTPTNYYYLPKKRLTKKEVLMHSIYVAEQEKNVNDIIFIALFYAKFKTTFGIKHPVLTNIKAILSGENIKGYPTHDEIRDRARVYDITL